MVCIGQESGYYKADGVRKGSVMKNADAIWLGLIFLLALLVFVTHARNSRRNRMIENVLKDLAEYELESALVF